MVVPSQWVRAIPVCVASLLLMLGMGCAGLSGSSSLGERLDYFQAPRADDVWTTKIRGWQRRERFDAALVRPLESGPAVQSAGQSEANERLPADQAAEGGLRAKYFEFRAERKRELAREVAAWIQ